MRYAVARLDRIGAYAGGGAPVVIDLPRTTEASRYSASIRYSYIPYPTSRTAAMVSGYGLSAMSMNPIW
jgi:hypothetical protein